MAGIGFELQRLIQKDSSFGGIVKGYIYSSVIATGPMLLVVLIVGFLNYFTIQQLSQEEFLVIQGLIIYTFGFSIIGTAPFLYVIMRYLSDKFFEKQTQAITPAYLTILEPIFVIQAIVALCALYPLNLDLGMKWLLLILYLSTTGIWVAMVFLSMARNYIWLITAFVLGGALGILMMLLWGPTHGTVGYLKGFTLGQATIFLLLNVRIFIEFGYEVSHDYGIFLYLKRFPLLVLIGICYYLGLWADRFLFWASTEGQLTTQGFPICTLYDVPVFLSFMTIVPSMAFFLVQFETSFARRCRDYVMSIKNRLPLSTIEKNHMEILDSIASNFERYVIFQGVISGFFLLFAVPIGSALMLSPQQISIFRISILGSFIQFGYIIILNLLFYFDFQKDILVLTLIFLVTNVLATLWSLTIGLPAYGFGFTIASFVSLLCGMILLYRKAKVLPYWTFMKHPIVIPKFKFESDTSTPVLSDFTETSTT